MTLKQGIRWLAKTVALLIGLFALFAVSDRITQIIIKGSLTALIQGPYLFLERTLPQIRWNTGAVDFFLLILVLLAAVLHHFLKWTFGSVPSAQPNDSRPMSWRWKWTLMMVSGLFLWFATTLSLVAFQNQTRWLIESDEKWIQAMPRGGRLFAVAKIISTAIQGVDEDPTITSRAVVVNLHASFSQNAGWGDDKEDFEYAFVYGEGHVLKRLLVTYRNPEKRKQAGFVEIDATDGVLISYPIELFQDYLNPNFTGK